MTGSVNEVENVVFSFIFIVHLDRMALDGDTLLFLKIHRVQNLILHITRSQGICNLEHTVCKSTLTVIDVRNYAKISSLLHHNQQSNHCKDNAFFRTFVKF